MKDMNVLQRETGKSQLDPAVVARFGALEYPEGVILAEYVWEDADGNTRSKTRTLPAEKVSPNCLTDSCIKCRPIVLIILFKG